MVFTFIDKQKAENYAGGSYLYKIDEIDNYQKFQLLNNVMNLDNLIIKKIKFKYLFDNEEIERVFYRLKMTEEEFLKRYEDSEILEIKIKGETNDKKISVLFKFKENNVMIKTDYIKERDMKKIVHDISK